MDNPMMCELITIARGNPELYDKFHANEARDSMIAEAQILSHVVLKGVGFSLATDPWEVFKCSNFHKVGQHMESLLYYGLVRELQP